MGVGGQKDICKEELHPLREQHLWTTGGQVLETWAESAGDLTVKVPPVWL